MVTRKKYIIGLILILVVLIVGGFFIFSYVTNRNKVKNPNENKGTYTPEGEISQSIDNPEVIDSSEKNDSAINNQELANSLQPTDDMKKVISENKNDLNNSDVVDQMAQSYPSNVIPLYKAKSAADSSDIITQNGNPGWTAQYGSDATVPEIARFYESLLSSEKGYKTTDSGDSKIIEGTIQNCSVNITVSPNNPERTGLNDMANVSIFIERQ